MTFAKSITLTEAQWDRIARKFAFVENGCWLWTGHVSGKGLYGRVSLMEKSYSAHRVIYEHLVGPIPGESQLDHLCRENRCVNPGHLEVVDNRTNFLRGTNKNAIRALQTHCKRGHELVEGNLRPQPKRAGAWGIGRQCLTCHRGYWERKRLGLP